MDAEQIRLLDQPGLHLAGRRDRVGAMAAAPAWTAIIAAKIGLRTNLNRPSVTRSVRSAESTPIRHDSPIVC